ncbi:MAG: type VI secretion system-associated FHA domain protein TagH [Steroidobacteraceae bacterium]
MTLILEIAGVGAAPPGTTFRKEFSSTGGTIGRAADNDWVVPDPYISGHHARVHFLEGCYLLEDVSTNGIFLDSQGTRLKRGTMHELESGSCIFLDQLEVRVSISRPDAADDFDDADEDADQDDEDDDSVSTQRGAVQPSRFPPEDATCLMPPEMIPESENDLPRKARDAAPKARREPPSLRRSAPAADKTDAMLPSSRERPDYANRTVAMPPSASGFGSDRTVAMPYDSSAPANPAMQSDRTVAKPAGSALNDDRTALMPATPAPRVGPKFPAKPSPPRADAGAPAGSNGSAAKPMRPAADAPIRQEPAPTPKAPDATERPAKLQPEPVADATVMKPATVTGKNQAAPAVVAEPPAAPTPRPDTVRPREFTATAATPPAAATSAPAATQSGEKTDLAVLLEAAGIPSHVASPELAQMLGVLLRETVSNLVSGLHERKHDKDVIQTAHHTMLKQHSNNPLKFSANVDDAMHNLFVKRNPAYLDAAEAITQGLQEIRYNNLALKTALRVGLDSAVRSFDPERLQPLLDQRAKQTGQKSMFGGPKYWKVYRDYYRELTSTPGTAYASIVGEDVARAYESELDALRQSERGK